MVYSVINILYRGPYEPPLRSNWTQGVKLLLNGVCTSISIYTYITLCFKDEVRSSIRQCHSKTMILLLLIIYYYDTMRVSQN